MFHNKNMFFFRVYKPASSIYVITLFANWQVTWLSSSTKWCMCGVQDIPCMLLFIRLINRGQTRTQTSLPTTCREARCFWPDITLKLAQAPYIYSVREGKFDCLLISFKWRSFLLKLTVQMSRVVSLCPQLGNSSVTVFLFFIGWEMLLLSILLPFLTSLQLVIFFFFFFFWLLLRLCCILNFLL